MYIPSKLDTCKLAFKETWQELVEPSNGVYLLACKEDDETDDYTIDMERLAGLNIHGFRAIEVFTEILLCVPCP